MQPEFNEAELVDSARATIEAGGLVLSINPPQSPSFEGRWNVTDHHGASSFTTEHVTAASETAV